MSIYNNIYMKQNKFSSLLINGVAVSDYAYVQLSFEDYFREHHKYQFMLDIYDAYKLANLLHMKPEATGSDAYPHFLAKKIKSFEYFPEPREDEILNQELIDERIRESKDELSKLAQKHRKKD